MQGIVLDRKRVLCRKVILDDANAVDSEAGRAGGSDESRRRQSLKSRTVSRPRVFSLADCGAPVNADTGRLRGPAGAAAKAARPRIARRRRSLSQGVYSIGPHITGIVLSLSG